LPRDHVIEMRSQTGRISDEPGQQILGSTLQVQLTKQRDRVWTVNASAEDQERENAVPDLPAG
jgi:hypothetical protein